MEQELTFDQLPKAVTMLTKEVSELKQLLLNKSEQQPPDQPEQLLTIQGAAKFLSLSVPTMYGKTHLHTVPFMKRGKRLYFSKAELLEYIKQGRKLTNDELKDQAYKYIKK